MEQLQYFVQWLKENIPTIVATCFTFSSAVMYIVDVLKMSGTKKILSQIFKEESEKVKSVERQMDERYRKRIEETEQLLRDTQEELRKQKAENLRLTNELKEFFIAETKKIRDSVIEIAENSKPLVSSGVAETIVKRLESILTFEPIVPETPHEINPEFQALFEAFGKTLVPPEQMPEHPIQYVADELAKFMVGYCGTAEKYNELFAEIIAEYGSLQNFVSIQTDIAYDKKMKEGNEDGHEE